jgi:hypothetical protein
MNRKPRELGREVAGRRRKTAAGDRGVFLIWCCLAMILIPGAGVFAAGPLQAEGWRAPPPVTPLETVSPAEFEPVTVPGESLEEVPYSLVARPAEEPVVTWRERADSLDAVTLQVSSGYDVVQSDIYVIEGTAFHLAQPDGATQIIELNPDFLAQADTRLFFESRLGWATSNQVARVQISTDGGSNWSNLWSQTGSNDSGEGAFSRRTMDLSSYAGQVYRLRFVYAFTGDSLFTQTDPGVGWYIDDIQIGADFVTRLYSIGDPTPEEQLFLEFINRARADVMAEAWRLRETDDPDVQSATAFFEVDFDLLIEQFEDLADDFGPSAPPLAFHEGLTTASRLHSQDMFDNVFQEHSSSNNPPPPHQPGDSPADRAGYQGYVFQSISENVYAFAESVWHGHAGFNIDWGTAPGGGSLGGMQDPPGHRLNIHDPVFREIGIGVVLGSNSAGGDSVGPVIVTQKFGTPAGGGAPLITGVAWEDRGETGFYAPGDGLGGIEVRVEGGSYHAVTSASGGYALPVPGDGEYLVTFSGGGYGPHSFTVLVEDDENVKLDYRPDELLAPGFRIVAFGFQADLGRARLDVEAPAGVDLLLETSTDLREWIPLPEVLAVPVGAGVMRFEPESADDRRFYRVVIEE